MKATTMRFRLPTSNAPIIAGSFGVGLLLAGRYILGLTAVGVSVIAHFLINPSAQNAGAGQKLKNSETHNIEPPPIDNWFYEKDGAAIGPLLETQVFELMKNDEISNETLVYNAAVSDKWISLDDTHFIKRNHHRGY